MKRKREKGRLVEVFLADLRGRPSVSLGLGYIEPLARAFGYKGGRVLGVLGLGHIIALQYRALREYGTTGRVWDEYGDVCTVGIVFECF